ncbi:hypothetical protein [Caproiciproducens sp. CPB-2]|uniref:hypothetical protein n=1 Tax=unclassified Caproiciproducens TaxID=2643836 RepID=UPI0023DC707E|nr:hypothetical protein [Caproiciproducens sp. CPB-2]MDF1493316.1 hypothetical protein [Caproiciproducens sp. CPB-2]
MSDGKLAVLFFEAGIVLTLISMVLGPFEITGWALACASVACFVALAGMYLAFCSWNEPDEEDEPPPEEPHDTEAHEK